MERNRRVLAGARLRATVLRVRSAVELGAEAGGEADRGFDLDFADRDALDVEAEGDAEAAAEADQVDRGRGGLLVGSVEGVVGVAQLIFDPARDADSEPAEELE